MAASEMFFDEVDPDSIGGFDTVVPGSYFGRIFNVDEHSDQKGKVIIDIEIISGTVGGQEGKHQRIFLGRTNNKMDVKKMMALAIAVGATTTDDLKRLKNEGKGFSFDPQAAMDKCVCVKLEMNDYNGKITTQLSYDSIYHPLDKRAASIPLHAATLKAAGITLPPERPLEGFGGAPANQKPSGGGSGGAGAAAQQQASPTPPINVDSLLDGLV